MDADVVNHAKGIYDMFELSQEEFESISKKAMLNDELKQILEMKIKGYSITQISMKLNISERTTYRRIKQLKKKIMKVL
jgi:DNA-binding NarL/FixJ family response regulator